MNNTDKDLKEFSIYIDFEKSVGDPSRVFRAMASLIETFGNLDTEFLSTLGETASVDLVLDDIESGSLRAWLRSVLVAIPDEAIKDLEIKKLIGHFLLKAKYKLVLWLDDNPVINSIEQVRVLEGELIDLAVATNIKQIPAYAPVGTRFLLSQVNEIRQAVELLDENDTIEYDSALGKIPINKTIKIDEDLIRDILTRETIDMEGERIIMIKKPDYLGKSKWVFRYHNHSIEAKFEDESWLNEFQNNNITLQPGDSLRVIMQEQVSYGYESEVVNVLYSIKKVIGIVPSSKFTQSHFKFDR